MAMSPSDGTAWCASKAYNNRHHRRVPHPIGGVLSLDNKGPFIRAPDLKGYKAAYILVGVLTWAAPKKDEAPKLEPGAPNFDAEEDAEAPALEARRSSSRSF